MQVRELRRDEWEIWDAYVRQAPGGLPQHLAGWQQVLANTYGYETHYLGAWCSAGTSGAAPQLVGVLPLFLISSPLVGRFLTTLPGGLCADNAAAADALLAHGRTLVQARRAKRLVLHDSRQAWPGALQTTTHHEHWLVDLAGGEAAILARLHRNIRRQIRIAQQGELTVVVDRTGARLDDFYSVMSRFTHQAGTPIFGRKFLAEVVAAFPGGFEIVIVYHQAQPIGGYFQLALGDTNYGVWGATLYEYLKLHPVYLAYWTILAESAAQGFAYLDMGRSPSGSNASKYKAQWATRSAPVYQQVWLAQPKPGVDHAGSMTGSMSVAQQAQENSRFQTFRRIWPRLPLPVAEILGPLLRRHIPFA